MNILDFWFIHLEREALRKKTDDELKSLWDQYDGTNAPAGFQGEEIHRELNRRYLGAYCAV